MNSKHCRCGHDGTGDHPCHANNYACRKPAVRRLYNAQMVGLSGMQFKVEVTDTWACDACWDEFQKKVKALGANEGII